MNFKRVSTLALALSTGASLVQADARFGQASDLFTIGVGARAMAMGSAMTGLADDASAPYFNPAGIALQDEHKIMAMHAPLFLDTDFNYLATIHPFGDRWGAVAISDVLLTSDKFELRDQFNQLTDSNGETRENALVASYARKLPVPMPITAGLNLKYIQQEVAGLSGDDFGIDLGFMYRPSRLLSAGLFLGNINEPAVTLDSGSDEYRPITRIGLASEVFADRLLLSADVVKVTDQDTIYTAGFEYTPIPLFQFRGGYNQNQSYTFGIGMNLSEFSIDYAFSDTDLGAFSKFSFTWAWHNIYQTDITPPIKAGRPVHPLAGFENEVVFLPHVPSHFVARWALEIKNGEGETVRMLNADLRPPERIVWDAKNEFGEPVVAGLYTYHFGIDYKNGKSWTVNGDLNLTLPSRKIEEVIDMTLQLNGTERHDEAAATPLNPQLVPVTEANPVDPGMQAAPAPAR